MTASLRATAAAPQAAAAGQEQQVLLGLDYNSCLELLSALSLPDLQTFLQSSRSACALLFEPAADPRQRFNAWQAVLLGRHPALEGISFDTESGDDWGERTAHMFVTLNIVCLLSVGSKSAETDEQIFSWLRSAVYGSGTKAAVPAGLTAAAVYMLASHRPPRHRGPDLYDLASAAIVAATAASASRIEAAAALPQGTLDGEWLRLTAIHAELCVTFAYLEQYHIKREGIPGISEMCAKAREECPAWAAQRAAGWVAPEVAPEPELAGSQPVLLVFKSDETFLTTVADLTGCDTLIGQITAGKPQPGKEFRLVPTLGNMYAIPILQFAPVSGSTSDTLVARSR
jgi:hypothetical protein